MDTTETTLETIETTLFKQKVLFEMGPTAPF